MIPLFKPYHSTEIDEAVVGVMRSGQIATGPIVAEFENKFGSIIGRPDVVATSDMTNALVIALKMVGAKPGKSVATVAFACLSTNSAIAMVGAEPVWVDIVPETMSMCPHDLKSKISKNTAAVILYHVAGYPAQLSEIVEICQNAGVPLIEDCNNALGAQFANQSIGRLGDYAVFSFYPNRQINAIDGAVIVCPDNKSAELARCLRRFGVDYSKFRDRRGEIDPRTDVLEAGVSAPFNQLSAAVGLTQIDTLPERHDMVRRNANILRNFIAGKDKLTVVKPVKGSDPIYWTFLILVKQRDEMLLKIKNDGIHCSIMHCRNDVYSCFKTGMFKLPGTEYVMKHILALPCGWWLTENDMATIAKSVVKNLN